MNKLTSLFLIAIFFLSLCAGIVIGSSIVGGGGETLVATYTAVQASSTNQTLASILVLGVNGIENDVIYLESAWLITILQSEIEDQASLDVIMVALYPISSEQVSNPGQSIYVKPHEPIVFPKEYLGSMETIQLLNAVPLLNRSDIYIEEVIVVDEFAMNYIIALTNTNPDYSQAEPTENTFLKPWDDPETVLQIQHNILETLCSPPQNLLKYEHFSQVLGLSTDHYRSTLSAEEIISLWQVIINLDPPPTVECEIYP